MRQMVFTIKELITGNVSVKNLSGPVGIYSVVDETRKEASAAFINLLHLLALLSKYIYFQRQ